MKNKSRDVIVALKAAGWFEVKSKKTSHKHFKHQSKPGKITVPCHAKELHLAVLKSIEKQAGIKLP